MIFWGAIGWLIAQSYFMVAAYSILDEYQLLFTRGHLSLTQLHWLRLFVCPLAFSVPCALIVALLVSMVPGPGAGEQAG